METYPLISDDGEDLPLDPDTRVLDGNLDLDEVEFDMPPGLEEVTGWVDVMNYHRPLPRGLKRIRGELFAGDYPLFHPLPDGLRVDGEIVE